jgi:hypothetical protein
MTYVLIALPHLVGLVALLAWAFSTGARGGREEPEEGFGGGGGLRMPPRMPQPVRPRGGLPLADAAAPPRRLRVGQRLGDLYPARARRSSHPRPDRAPTQR